MHYYWFHMQQRLENQFSAFKNKYLIWIESTVRFQNAGALIDFMQSYITHISGFKIGWKKKLFALFSSLVCITWNFVCIRLKNRVTSTTKPERIVHMHSHFRIYFGRFRRTNAHFEICCFREGINRRATPCRARCWMLMERIKYLKEDEPFVYKKFSTGEFVDYNLGLNLALTWRQYFSLKRIETKELK